MPFQDSFDKPGDPLLSEVVAEMIRTELGAGNNLRVTPGEEISHMAAEFSIRRAGSLEKSTLRRIRQRLNADYAVAGLVTELNGSSEVRLDLKVQNTQTGEVIAAESAVGQRASLFDVVGRCGGLLRSRLGASKLTISDAEALRGELPGSIAATELYVGGLNGLRMFDPIRARELLLKAAKEDPKSAVIHSALAEAWASLGYEQRAKQEGQIAFGLSHNLTRENQLLIEGRYSEFAKAGPRAIETYQALWTYFPDDLEYGLRLVKARIRFGKESEVKDSFAKLRRLPPPYGTDPRIDLLEAEAAENRGDFQKERQAADRAIEKGTANNNRLLVARAQLRKCWALDYLGDRVKARELAEEAERTFHDCGDKGNEAIALKNIADVLDDGGNHSTAVPIYERAAAIFGEVGSQTGVAVTLNNAGYAIKDMGDLRGAREHFARSVTICREIGGKGREAQALNGLAGVLKREGKLAEAQNVYEAALARMDDTNQQDRAGTVLNNLAEVLQYRGRLAEAQRRFEQSLDIAKKKGDQTAIARAEGNLGILALSRGDLVAAQKYFEDQLAIGDRIHEEKQRGYALQGLGSVCFERSDSRRAQQLFEQALSIRQKAGEEDLVAEARLALAEHKQDDKELTDLVAFFKRTNRPDENALATTYLIRSALASIPPKLQSAGVAASELGKLLSKIEDQNVQLQALSALAQYDAVAGKKARAEEQLRTIVQRSSQDGFVLRELESTLELAGIVSNKDSRKQLFKSVEESAQLRHLTRLQQIAASF